MLDIKKTVDDIVADLTDRRGLRQEWEEIDPEIQEDIKQAWMEIISANVENSKG